MSLLKETRNLAEVNASVSTFTLDRPDRGNALNEQIVDELAAAIETAGSSLLVLRGNGRNFCTGFDLANIADQSDADLLLRFLRVEEVLQALAWSPTPTLAVAQGRSFGAGADLFVTCDQRICLPGATFAFPGPAFGLVLGSRRLAERVGRDAARDILLSGRVVTAEEALDLGLATAIVQEDAIDAMVTSTARKAARLDALTVQEIRVATGTHGADQDMAALVRSAIRPGLQKRISKYTAARSAR